MFFTTILTHSVKIDGFANEVHLQDLQDLEEKNVDALKNSAFDGVR